MNRCGYDQAVNIFSPTGRLLQVEYAQEAVKLGAPAVGICGEGFVILAVDKESTPELQSDRVIKKINILDDHIMMTFAGLSADAHVLTDRTRVECQSHKIMIEDPASVEYVSRYIANMQQRYTQTNSRRPFGVSTLIAGFDSDGTSHLFKTDPSGAYHEWTATSTGRDAEVILQFLESTFSDEIASNEDSAVKLAIQALILVIEEVNLEIAVMKRDQSLRFLDKIEVFTHIFGLVRELEAEEEMREEEIDA